VRLSAAQAIRTLGSKGAPAIPVLRRMLEGPDPASYWLAVETLGAIGPAAGKAIPALIDGLVRGSDEEFRATADALRRIGPAEAGEAIPRYRRALETLPHRRQLAVLSLASAYGGAAAPLTPRLAALVDHQDGQIRAAALAALGRIGEPIGAVVDALVRALDDPDLSVRGSAYGSLRQLGPRAAQAVPQLVERALRDLGPWSDSSGWSILWTIDAPAEAALPPLFAALADPALRERAASLLGLGPYETRQTSPRAVGMLLEALAGSVPEARYFAAEYLSRMRPLPPLALKPIAAALGDPNPEVRYALLGAIEAAGASARDLAQPLLDALRDPDSRVHGRAREILLALGPELASLLPDLERLALTPGLEERVQLARQLVWKIDPNGRRVLPGVLEALERPESFEPAQSTLYYLPRDAVASAPLLWDALARTRDEQVMDALCAALRSLIDPQQAAEQLTRALRAPDPAIQLQAARMLTLFPEAAQATIPALIPLLKDPDPDLRLLAIQVLGEISRGAAYPFLRMVPESIGAIREALVRLCSDPWPSVRSAAYFALRNLGQTPPKECGPELILAPMPFPPPAAPQTGIVPTGIGPGGRIPPRRP
jgi:HEAT repeat protein